MRDKKDISRLACYARKTFDYATEWCQQLYLSYNRNRTDIIERVYREEPSGTGVTPIMEGLNVIIKPVFR